MNDVLPQRDAALRAGDCSRQERETLLFRQRATLRHRSSDVTFGVRDFEIGRRSCASPVLVKVGLGPSARGAGIWSA